MWKEKEYLELLESNGIDTVCFMGTGYVLEDVKVGAEFYLPYAYFGRYAKKEKEDALTSCLHFYSSYNVLDKYKIISKYKYFNSKINPALKRRREWVVVKNLRTKEEIVLKDSYGYTGSYGNDNILIEHMHLYMFDTFS